MISCRRAVELTTKELDIDLVMMDRLAVGFHRFVCPMCARFRKQIVEVEAAMTEYVQHTGDTANAELPAETKIRMMQALKAAATEDTTG
jgi:hypothetical protein